MTTLHTIKKGEFDINVAETAESFTIGEAELPKTVLARLFAHGRCDFAAFNDFLNGAWTWANHPPALVDDAPRDIRALIDEAQASAKGLLNSLSCNAFDDYMELMTACAPHTTHGRENALCLSQTPRVDMDAHPSAM